MHVFCAMFLDLAEIGGNLAGMVAKQACDETRSQSETHEAPVRGASL